MAWAFGSVGAEFDSLRELAIVEQKQRKGGVAWNLV